MATDRILGGLLALAVIAAFIQTLRIYLPAALRRARLRAAGAHAQAAEFRAEELLRQRGFEILARQVRGQIELSSNGEPHTYPLRADLLVGRGPDRYVAEVKTGASAPWLDNRHTRRQLLEYSVAFPVDGVLLVRADENEIELVRFGKSESPAPTARWWWVAALLAALAGYVLGARTNTQDSTTGEHLLCLELPYGL